ncbi:ricin B lectin domain-containing protein [Flammula alnicola]|nr:ricin B lectin domain-containing protein [Flammula alnicola]KAF8962030.1 ricin B lectin domain-containing protein [Flammula alnicola]
MHYLTYFLSAVTAAAAVRAALPPANQVVQIQPITRGSFPRTPCLTVLYPAANGSALIINDCSTLTQERGFQVVEGGATSGEGTPGPIEIFNTFCLEVTGGADVSGTKVEINRCVTGDPNQLWEWNSDATVVWSGTDKCLDLTNGNLNNGNQIQIWTCTAGNINQQWTANTLANPISEVVIAAQPDFCMAADSSENGAPVFITSCNDTTALKVWSVPQVGHGNSGSYKLAFGPDGSAPIKCLDLTDGNTNPGTKLQLWDCVENLNQYWTPGPTDTILWEGSGEGDLLCVDLTDGITTRGNPLQVWTCTAGNTNQLWNDTAPPQTAV